MSTVLDLFRTDVKSRRGRLAEVAEATGIKRKTLQNYLYYLDRDPRGSNLEKLREYYEHRETA